MNIIEQINKESTPERNFPKFRVGDTVKVFVKVKEGNKERVQPFQGVCIGIKGGGVNSHFRVRKLSSGIGVERVFPFYGPTVESVEMIQAGQVRRAKLYYMRDRIGKSATKVKMRKRVTAE